MGYIREINPNSRDSHQVSPAYVLTFTRWSNRDTFNYKDQKPLDVRKPLVVYNDAISVVTTDSKGSMSATATVVLKCGDINYATALHPGDFMIVNLVDWDSEAQAIHDKALLLKPINEVDDGFKGVYKIQSVVKTLRVDRASGNKQLYVTVTAASHTEFNNVIYYNPAIAASFSEKGAALWATAIGDYYSDKLKSESSCQEVVKDLFKILVGQSHKKPDPKIKNYGNTHFRIPATLGALLGRPDIKFANEFFNYVVGMWKDSKESKVNDKNIGPGFNPGFVQDKNRPNFITTGRPIQGRKEVTLENWNNQTSWSIIQGNINSVLNEMYTTHRVGPDNRIYPTIVVRQKPFTTDHFKDSQLVTRFSQVPRWRISSNLLYDLQTSKNDAARFNFVQVYTRQLADTAEMDMAQQISLGNFVYDQGDIQRQGLRPYVVTSNFDFPAGKGTNSDKQLHGYIWSRIVGDWVIDGHLKESGVLTFQGLKDPVAVGDNLEFDNVIYHIEGVSHTMTINGDKKSWTTKLTVTYGIDMSSSKAGPVYANMTHTDAQTQNDEDWVNERILPGISDTQDITGRVNGEEIKPTEQISFTPKKLQKPRKNAKQRNSRNDGENN
jgi:hypothetical protein